MQEKLVPTCLASIKLWPIAHAINFAFIPSSQRLLYINVISVSLLRHLLRDLTCSTIFFFLKVCLHADESEGQERETLSTLLHEGRGTSFCPYKCLMAGKQGWRARF